MAQPSGSKRRITVVHFEKPADRLRTVLEMQVPAPRDTRPELPRTRTRDKLPSAGARGATAGGKAPAGPRRAPLTPDQAAELAVFGHHLFEQGQLAEARVVFEGLVELGLDDPFPHTMLGIIFHAQGDPSRALALFEAALALDPEDLAARVYRAEIRLSNGKVARALEELGQVVKDAPKGDPFADRARKLIARSAGGPSQPGRRKRR